jgi:hypothetical protein
MHSHCVALKARNDKLTALMASNKVLEHDLRSVWTPLHLACFETWRRPPSKLPSDLYSGTQTHGSGRSNTKRCTNTKLEVCCVAAFPLPHYPLLRTTCRQPL